ncbi:hypothetical protein [Jannaschia seohaensis]|uniref:Uncharacterized protein n=1 Tax=Jannaschia seohaensis TaxID=475081 RepID=A0A2Y9B747_9RHOB|nr:hypothetical protein [Jannaschia seohaensis]PWJ09844.1 hypothetical protein BCF38_1285 [Jannaschia seohaensis]SSA51925.1 hypothetical protein SAMN05421539_1285 [Jannaschia seohaensis]
MIETLSSPRAATSHAPFFAPLRLRILDAFRRDAEARRLETMPRDRLEDMGIPGTTETNRRSSGEAGPIPRATLW